MRYFEENGDTYNSQIEKIEREDLVEAGFVNGILQQLINNSAFLKKRMNQQLKELINYKSNLK